MMSMMAPVLLFGVIGRNPNSLLAVVTNYLPPLNSTAMMIRLASSQPPPWWEVCLSIGVGLASVVGTLWVAAKVFTVGLLLHGKPPNFSTLGRWARKA